MQYMPLLCLSTVSGLWACSSIITLLKTGAYLGLTRVALDYRSSYQWPMTGHC